MKVSEKTLSPRVSDGDFLYQRVTMVTLDNYSDYNVTSITTPLFQRYKSYSMNQNKIQIANIGDIVTKFVTGLGMPRGIAWVWLLVSSHLVMMSLVRPLCSH